ncbi:acyl carrier protein [Nocardia sp. NBC_01503]|uniref:acyl carrier protein n=1 Tax=Nocardia sp. NBC_01503 TaxID=2975997 RepID=UPI002E7C21C9|nr:acyl carrier protein [Nocardia sp. NBC_01503]WTL30601.1 acyl carrier protein [Nocardia sp. NBC_01503]
MKPIEFESWLRDRIVELSSIGSRDEIRFDEPLASHGMSSPELIMLTGEISEQLGRQISPTVVFRYPTLRLLVQYLTSPGDDRCPPPPADHEE